MTNYDNLLHKIKQDLEKCVNQKSGLGALGVKIKSFKDMLNSTNLDTNERNRLSNEITQVYNEFKQLEQERNRQRAETHREMRESNLMVNRTDELHSYSNTAQNNPYITATDNDFYKSENSKLDKIISSGYDSLNNLKKQDELLENINDKLKSGLKRLGLSVSVMEKIEKRTLGDKSFFYFMVLFIVFLMFLFKFIL